MADKGPDVLKEMTNELHAKIEETPFAKAFLHKELPLQAYVGYIRLMTALHTGVENALGKTEHPGIVSLWKPEYTRLPKLHDDFLWFRTKLFKDQIASVEATLSALKDIRLISQENPAGLLGCIYVLWGSTKGAVTLAPLAGKMFDAAPGKGLSYLTQHAGDGANQWEEMAPSLGKALADSEDLRAAELAAVSLFNAILNAFTALCPVDEKDLQYHTLSLNPNSGTHDVPDTPEAIRAIYRASDRCLAEYPYFITRYGMSGYFFSDSDGAYLTTLAQSGETTLKEKVRWLTGVLSSRGIPGILMKRHLEILQEELQLAVPEKSAEYSLLSACAVEMGHRYELILPLSERDKLTETFLDTNGLGDCFMSRQAAELILAAVVDEADGLMNSVNGILEYYTDTKRFSPQFITAGKMLVDTTTARFR